MKNTYNGTGFVIRDQTFMKWFNHDQAFKYFNEMDSTSVATVVFAFDEKNIE
ncbi:protoporphyrinogen oxidase, partial [Staphylococcus aureus]